VTIDVIAEGFWLTECPRFDADEVLYFSDVMGHKFCRYTSVDGVQVIDDSRRFVGGCVINEDGRVIHSGLDGLAAFDPATDTSQPIETMLDGQAIGSINDIEADRHGNIYGGTIDLSGFENGTPQEPGIIFRLDTSGLITELGPVGTPNGMAFSPDGGQLYLAESGEGVFVYDVRPDGTLANRQLFAALEDCDGIALDEKGGLWVARYMCSELAYYHADGSVGVPLQMPYNSVTSVVFGGNDLRDLYVTGGDLQQSGSGGVIKLSCETPGLPSNVSRLGC
jgi:xylono-1,5-lactonase